MSSANKARAERRGVGVPCCRGGPSARASRGGPMTSPAPRTARTRPSPAQLSTRQAKPPARGQSHQHRPLGAHAQKKKPRARTRCQGPTYLPAAARRAGEGRAPASRAASRPAAPARPRFSSKGSAAPVGCSPLEPAALAMPGGWKVAVAGAPAGRRRAAGGEASSPSPR